MFTSTSQNRQGTLSVRGHSFSTYAKFSEKLTFTSWYAHVSVRIRGLEILVFLENVVYVLNEWPQIWEKLHKINFTKPVKNIFRISHYYNKLNLLEVKN